MRLKPSTKELVEKYVSLDWNLSHEDIVQRIQKDHGRKVLPHTAGQYRLTYLRSIGALPQDSLPRGVFARVPRRKKKEEEKPSVKIREAKSKSDCIREAFQAGRITDREVTDWVKENYGLVPTGSLISQIRHEKKRRTDMRNNKNVSPSPEQQESLPPPPKVGLQASDLARLLDLAKRTGGIEGLKEWLHVLKNVRK